MAVDNAAERRKPFTKALPNLFNFFGRRFFFLGVTVVVSSAPLPLPLPLVGVADGGLRSGPRPSDGNSNTVLMDGTPLPPPPPPRFARNFCDTTAANAPPLPVVA